MLEFLNEALKDKEIDSVCLYPIYIDDSIIFRHFYNFSKVLLESLEHYYLSKNVYCLGVQTPYCYYLRLKQNVTPPVVCNLDYKYFLFYIEFTNTETKRSIHFCICRESSQVLVRFYSNYEHGSKNTNTKVRGTIYLISNMFDIGVSIQLLNIVYEFMENDSFDEEELFKKINII